MTRIAAERFGNRIHLKPLDFLGSERFAKYLAAVKRVPGVTYSDTHKCQTAPLDIEVCRLLRETFGKSLLVGEDLAAWAREAIDKEKELMEVARLDPTTNVELDYLPTVAPEFYKALQARGFQAIAVKFAAMAGPVIIADQPGLGKTAETFATIVELRVAGPVLVISPKTSLGATWAPEVEKWLGEVGARAFVIPQDNDNLSKRNAALEDALSWSRENPERLAFILVNAEMVRLKEIHDCPAGLCDGKDEYCQVAKSHKKSRETKYPVLFDVEWSALVGDEVHRYLMNANPRAKSPSQVGLGFQRLKVRSHPDLPNGLGLKVALSGTPMKGKPRKLWPTLRWLRPDLYTSQWRWSKHYFKTEEDGYAYGGEKITDDLREDRIDAFNRELSRIMIRRTKSELRAINPAWAPPDKLYAEVWLPMSPAQRKAYKAMERDASVRLSGGTLSANGILAEMTRLRQFAGAAGRMEGTRFVPELPSNKIDWLIDSFLGKRGITGDPSTEEGESKVVVASQFTQFINLAAEALRTKGIAVHVLTGETKDRDRTAMQKDWQTPGGPRVMLLNTNAGGVSITLDYADDCVIMDETWVPDDQEQVEDRVHRTSRTDHQVTIWYVRSEDTIERDIAGTNIMKDDRQKRVLDARRGIEVARQKFNVEVE